VQALAEGLRPELQAAGVNVLCVAPGPTHTGFAARAKVRMGLADDAEGVAASIHQAIGRRGTHFPGLVGKLLRWGVLTLPRSLRTFIFGRAVAGMIQG
jgi:short-subunit dehydrogenase